MKDITGRQFGRLTAISVVGQTKGRNYIWACRCACGNEKNIVSGSLLSGTTKSCGCYQKEVAALCKSNLTHGDSYMKEYATWNRMISRCHYPKFPGYNHYGGRGIKVCDRWRHSYENFFADMGRAPSPKHSIDRINNDGNYEPDNCRWATSVEQANNKRTNRHIIYNGEKKTIAEWGAFLGVFPTMITAYLRNGKTMEQIINRRTYK